MINILEAKWKVYKERGRFQVRKLNDDGSKGDAVGAPHASYEEADKHLKALYVNVPDAKAEIINETNDMNANLMLGAVHFEADELNPRILRFKNVILARPETNKNRDNVSEQGIQELADTIAGMPIDIDHDSTKNLGYFTAGRVGDQGELRVDGMIWLDRCSQMGVDPQEVLDEEYGLSIEADAATAECSVCHKVHSNSNEYCSHIVNLRSKIRHGADRVLRGLRAIGGALTKKPAGSNTGWDALSGIVFVASHQEAEEMSDVNELTASEVVEMWINSMSAVEKREDVSPADKKRAESEYGDVEYADEKNKKYPIDKEHIHQAWSYINMPKNAEKYSPEDLKAIKDRIKRAAKKFGMDISEDKNKEEAAMDDEKKEAVESPKEEKTETPEEQKKEEEKGVEKDMKAEYEAMKATLADMTAKLETANTEKATLESELTAVKTQLTEANKTLLAHRKAELKAKFVGSVMDEEEFESKADTLLNAPQDLLDLLARPTVKPENPPVKMQAAVESTTSPAWSVA